MPAPILFNNDLEEFKRLSEQVFTSGIWAKGPLVRQFEEAWSGWNQMDSVATSSWAGGAMAALDYIDVKDELVLCCSNTAGATAMVCIKSGAQVDFVDCNKSDLCMSYESLLEKCAQRKPKAVWITHIGGHIAFQIHEIASFCKENNIWLLEDCAHAHGAEWNGIKPGTFGDAGVYSFFATKSVPIGEGGVLVSKHHEMINHARKYIQYGAKEPKPIFGLNFRMSEISAAIGLVQMKHFEDHFEHKWSLAKQLDQRFNQRVILPIGMKSGYYKYIIFEPVEQALSARVFDVPLHMVFDRDYSLPNSEWVAKNHWCISVFDYNELF